MGLKEIRNRFELVRILPVSRRAADPVRTQAVIERQNQTRSRRSRNEPSRFIAALLLASRIAAPVSWFGIETGNGSPSRNSPDLISCSSDKLRRQAIAWTIGAALLRNGDRNVAVLHAAGVIALQVERPGLAFVGVRSAAGNAPPE
jgi:hypothetical protein